MPRSRKPTIKPDPVSLDRDDLSRPVAVYYRQSSTEQLGNVSYEIQKTDIVEDLKRRGWSEDQIILIDDDEAVSGTLSIDARKGMRRLFDLIVGEEIGTVAVQAEDRLFRDEHQVDSADRYDVVLGTERGKDESTDCAKCCHRAKDGCRSEHAPFQVIRGAMPIPDNFRRILEFFVFTTESLYGIDVRDHIGKKTA